MNNFGRRLRLRPTDPESILGVASPSEVIIVFLLGPSKVSSISMRVSLGTGLSG